MTAHLLRSTAGSCSGQYRGPMTRRPLLMDGAVALVLAGGAVIEILSAHGHLDVLVANSDATIGVLWLDLVVGIGTCLSLALRRVRPAAAFSLVFALQTLANVLFAHHFPFFSGIGALTLVAYSFGRHSRPDLARWGWVAAFAWTTTFPLHTPEARDPASVLFAGLLLTAPWAAGVVIQRLASQRRALDAALAELSQLEDTRREASLLAERTRIAREMHDVLAHGITVMVVQAGAARLDVPEDSAARGSLLSVEQTGRRVLSELRRTVGLLRSPDAADEPAPAPGLADLPALVESMRAAGLRVSLDLAEGSRPDAARELVAYRIVQEALTNTLRHAGPTTALVRVSGGNPLTVQVTDTGGRARTAEGGGFGLAGLRERVELYGGTLSATRAGAGFELTAVIPWEELA